MMIDIAVLIDEACARRESLQTTIERAEHGHKQQNITWPEKINLAYHAGEIAALNWLLARLGERR